MLRLIVESLCVCKYSQQYDLSPLKVVSVQTPTHISPTVTLTYVDHMYIFRRLRGVFDNYMAPPAPVGAAATRKGARQRLVRAPARAEALGTAHPIRRTVRELRAGETPLRGGSQK